MLLINKAIFRIAGVCVLLVSAILLSVYFSGFSDISTIQSFMYQISGLGIVFIGVYSGFQLVKLRKVGLRLLIIWLLCQLLTMTFFVFPALVSWSLSFVGTFHITVPVIVQKLLTAAYYLLFPVGLLYALMGTKAEVSLVDDDPRQIRILAILLSVLTPGLARALVDNLLAGIVLFFSYWLLITGSHEWQASPESFDRILRWLVYIVGWVFLVKIDWYAVREFDDSERIKNDPAPSLAVKQGNGG